MQNRTQAAQLSLFVNSLDIAEIPNLRVATQEQRHVVETHQVEVLPTPIIRAGECTEATRELGAIPDCEWAQFIRANGRVPMADDPRKPWEYRGWLLYYRLLLELHPQVVPRWDFWYRTRLAGELLSEPIPNISFDGCASRECVKMFETWLRIVERGHNSWSPMDPLLDWFLWGFGISKEPPELSQELNSDLYRAVDIGPLLLHPYDYIGEWIAEQKGGWNPHAFFPTPHNVVEMMARMALDVEQKDLREQKIMDPCLGSGRMLLHASNYSLRLYGVDIDNLLVKASMVNGVLFAPWMVRPFPDRFFRDNTSIEISPNLAVGDAIARST